MFYKKIRKRTEMFMSWYVVLKKKKLNKNKKMK